MNKMYNIAHVMITLFHDKTPKYHNNIVSTLISEILSEIIHSNSYKSQALRKEVPSTLYLIFLKRHI